MTRRVASGSLGVVSVVTEANKMTLRARQVECPRCGAQFLVRKAAVADCDGEGVGNSKIIWKSCAFAQCEVLLTGVVDPYNEDSCWRPVPERAQPLSTPFLRQKVL
jgi:hypothetical protein